MKDLCNWIPHCWLIHLMWSTPTMNSTGIKRKPPVCCNACFPATIRTPTNGGTSKLSHTIRFLLLWNLWKTEMKKPKWVISFQWHMPIEIIFSLYDLCNQIPHCWLIHLMWWTPTPTNGRTSKLSRTIRFLLLWNLWKTEMKNRV